MLKRIVNTNRKPEWRSATITKTTTRKEKARRNKADHRRRQKVYVTRVEQLPTVSVAGRK